MAVSLRSRSAQARGGGPHVLDALGVRARLHRGRVRAYLGAEPVSALLGAPSAPNAICAPARADSASPSNGEHVHTAA